MPIKRSVERDRAKELWETAGGSKAPRGTLKKIAENLGIEYSVIRAWKSKDDWDKKPKSKNLSRDRAVEAMSQTILSLEEAIIDLKEQVKFLKIERDKLERG